MTRRRGVRARRLGRVGALALLLAAGQSAEAQSPVGFSPDITANLGTVGASVVAHQNLAYDDGAGTVALLLPTTLPPNADVIAQEYLAGGDVLLSFDVTVALPGLPPGMPAEPRDVVRYTPATMLSVFAFDGSANGVPGNARVDAVGVDAGGDLLLSFDTSLVLVPAGPVDDEDLVRFAGGLFFLVYDGSANGIAPGLDLDGASAGPGATDLLLSFDASGVAGGVFFDDEDALVFDTALLTYAMFFDASLSDPVSWPAADLVALPEAGGVPSLLAGVSLLGLLSHRTRRRRREARRL